jgi:hypothetical protein
VGLVTETRHHWSDVMRSAFLLCSLLFAAGCETKHEQGSAIQNLDTYTEGNTTLQSREQVRHYAEIEGRMYKIEKDVKELRERMGAGLTLTPEKQVALAAVDNAVKAARTKIAEIRAAGSTTWEGLKAGVEAAVVEAEARHKTFAETP